MTQRGESSKKGLVRMTRNKFSAKRNGIFDSQFEGEVYRTIVNYFPRESVLIHKKLQLTDSITWAIDFQVQGLPNPLYIEAKGYCDDTFKLKLKLIKDMHPAIASNLYLVVSSEKSRQYLIKHHAKEKVILLSHFAQFLFTYKVTNNE